jgi:hypothetical protein
LHIPAGNGGLVSAVTIIRNAITRSDAIVKIPSNDPLTAMAIARTLAEVAPNHPLTRHLAVAYWKGGDTEVEERLYRPEKVEKIVAWGGFASVKHVTRYLQPGLELIALDPKRSATIIGPEAFESAETLREVALRAACDIGVANQEGCACARVIWVLCGSDAAGVEKANRLGQAIYEALVSLPEHQHAAGALRPRATRPPHASRMADDWFRVIGGERDEGAIIVSQIDEAVDYSPRFAASRTRCRWTRSRRSHARSPLTPRRSVLSREAHASCAIAAAFGAQRLTSLGYACNIAIAAPQDAIEPVRRTKWIVEETATRQRCSHVGGSTLASGHDTATSRGR